MTQNFYSMVLHFRTFVEGLMSREDIVKKHCLKTLLLASDEINESGRKQSMQ